MDFNPSGIREVSLVGGPRDSEILVVKEDEYQVSFYGSRINTNDPEKVEYSEHTYVRDPDSFSFIYAGSRPLPEGPNP